MTGGGRPNAVAATLLGVAARFDRLGAAWALVGGLAVSVRAEPRFTRDVDVCVVVRDDAEAERLVTVLVSDGYRVRTVVEQDAVGRLATVRLTGRADDGTEAVLDLLFASSGIESEVVGAADRIEVLPSVSVPVARAGHLVALKLLARDDDTRPQDAADLIALRAVLTAEDRADAAAAVLLIGERGYERGRDLPTLLADYLVV